jgi:hypothetical protein
MQSNTSHFAAPSRVFPTTTSAGVLDCSPRAIRIGHGYLPSTLRRPPETAEQEVVVGIDQERVHSCRVAGLWRCVHWHIA